MDRPLVLVAGASQAAALAEAVLAVEGHAVVRASDSERALALARERHPGVVVLDALMLGRDGFQTCAVLKADVDLHRIPVMLLGAGVGTEDRLRAVEAGADDFLAQPLSRLDLLASVSALLRSRRDNDEYVSLESTVVSLANAVEAKDPYTIGHAKRVAAYAGLLAEKMGMGERDRRALRRAGVLHDVGKIGISESILTKPGPLTPDEFERIKQHPAVGERICRPLDNSHRILPLIRHHHERFDGRGYPDGLAGDAINPGARLMSVVDAFDALTSDRSYRRRLDLERALGVLEAEAGKQFDPVLARAFVALVRESKALQPKRGRRDSWRTPLPGLLDRPGPRC